MVKMTTKKPQLNSKKKNSVAQIGKLKKPRQSVQSFQILDTVSKSSGTKRKKAVSALQSPKSTKKQKNQKDLLTTLESDTGKHLKTPKKVKEKLVGAETSLKKYDAVNGHFDVSTLGEQFDIKMIDVENAVKGVVKFISNNEKLKNNLFDEEMSIFLQINSFKIPRIKGKVKNVFRVPLNNSILPSDADICIIVPDVKGIRNNEHEQHLEHYETLLRSKGVSGIKKIMTFHEFRTEYDTFELKRRLVDFYDVFLVDGRISGKVVHKCGSIFYKKRKLPVAIKLQVTELKSHIDTALKKVFFQMSFKGDSHLVQIGHTKMPTEAMVENVFSVVSFLNKHFPGKMDNVRSLNVYAHRGSSIPVYLSLKNPNEIQLDMLQSKKPKAYESVSGELTTQYNAHVTVRPGGKVTVKRSKIKAESNKENADEEGAGHEGAVESIATVKESKKSKRKITIEEHSTENEVSDGPQKKKTKTKPRESKEDSKTEKTSVQKIKAKQRSLKKISGEKNIKKKKIKSKNKV